MDKVLVEISVPVVGKTFDVFIPQTSKMSEIISLVSKSVSDLSGGKFKSDESTIICDADSGQIFNINLSIYELEIKNGSKLMLI